MSTRFLPRVCGAIVILVSVIAVGATCSGDSAVSPGSTGDVVYVVDDGSDTVSQFGVGAAGALSPLSPPVVSTGSDNSFNVAITPDGANAYVTDGINNTVSQFTINPADGTLSPMSPPTVATGQDNYDVTVSPDGRSAYVTNAIDNTVSQYNIDSVTGALSPKVPATVPTGPVPQGIVVTPDGKNAYLTNAGGLPGTTFTVSQYTIDPVTGTLSPMAPATVATGENPEHVAVTPDGRSAYVTDSDVATVSQYNIDPATGALSPKTPATVAAGTPGFDDVFGVVVTPNGKSVYVANSSNTVRQYDVDPISGALSPKTPPSVAAGIVPVDIAVTSDGTSAYVTNAASNDVSQFNIDPISGALSPKTPASVAAGVDPLGIAVRSATEAATTTAVLIPTAGTALSGTSAVLDAAASASAGVATVQFVLTGGSYNKSVIGAATPTLYGYVYRWNTTSVPGGTYTLQSLVTDDHSNTAYSAGIAVTVDNTPPTTAVLFPSNGASVKGTAVLDASASASYGVQITKVQFVLTGRSYNKTVIGTATPTLYGWVFVGNSTLVHNGKYILQSLATDAAGNTAYSTGITVKVKN